MLNEREIKALRLYYEGQMTVQEIAEACGWKNRASVYDLLKKKEAQDYIDQLEKESLKEALRILRINSKELSKIIVDIARGNIKNTKTVYAQLNALTNALEKAGLNQKTLVIEESKNDDQDYNELLDMLKKEEGSKEE
ncbi:hypothetical protein HPJ92_01810 [Anoxybacillus flavithermus]|uniref:hypothetical protein n=1 Tax=Anoxybacillus flavithermus TaxID=33934 RepID=UPI0018688818|nr:hypothetical protein [Anoxybacillus flavithermus]MBE2914752.1 hypothetical protein [Anoxybacillus flavithermus]MBE2931294.1 hypothetical protein [Anoxybacillus flavithermus]